MADNIRQQLNVKVEHKIEIPKPADVVGKVPKAEIDIQFKALIAMVNQSNYSS